MNNRPLPVYRPAIDHKPAVRPVPGKVEKLENLKHNNSIRDEHEHKR